MTNPIDTFNATLAALGLPQRSQILSESAHTAALAAEVLGIPVGAVANSLVFEERVPDPDFDPATPLRKGQNGPPMISLPVLIIASGDHKVDTALVSQLHGLGKLRRASYEFVLEHTGQPAGGCGPVGHPRPLRTFLDTYLRRFEMLFTGAGAPEAICQFSFEELLRITGATETSVCRDAAGLADGLDEKVI